MKERKELNLECWHLLEYNFESTIDRDHRFTEDLGLCYRMLVACAEQKGFWCSLNSPFFAGNYFWAGFTPHNCTGLNGRPDYEESAEEPALAVVLAFLALAEGENWGK